MERYMLLKEVGDGTFGNVLRAVDKQTGEVVAVKRMKKKYFSWEECVNLREVKSLSRMDHPNIVKLKEVIWENDILYFVFEYMDYNLYQLMKDRPSHFAESDIRNWCFQVFQGLSHMHQRGYFHRDLKPENLLVSKDVIKIADLGLAREINSSPPYTEYVSTRWYRAPELLLQSYVYTSKVDMWAMGAIMAELLSLRPLFPGASEADEIYKICSVLGSPTEETWLEGLNLASVINYQFPKLPGVHLSSVMPHACADAINLIERLCSWDPCNRPTAAEALQHPFFQSCYYVPPPLRPKMSVGVTGSLEQLPSVKQLPADLTYNSNRTSDITPKTYAPFGYSINSYVTPKKNAPFENSVNNYVTPKTNAPFGNSGTSYVTPKVNVPIGNNVNSYMTPKKAPFSNSVNSYGTPKTNALLGKGASQRKVDMANNNNQDTSWIINKPLQTYNAKDAKYRPPGRKSPLAYSMDKNWGFARGASETANRLSNGTLGGSWTQNQKQQKPKMKAGWEGESADMFLRPTQPSNPYSRRIAG